MTEQFTAAFIEKTLNLERFEDPEKICWLDNSFYDDSDFWPSLFKIHDRFFSTAGKSTSFKQYDFFHDIITRNINRDNPAFIWYDPMKHRQEISYRQLGQNAEQLALSWLQSGVMPGHTVCIVMKFGQGYVTSFLAGLRIGVILSFIMPEAKTLMSKQLESLDPDYIYTEDIYLPLLSGWQDKIINENNLSKKEKLKSVRSHTYINGEPVARLFDPVCEDIVTPKEVVSDLFFLSGIRDGIIGFGLAPGDMFAAPGFHKVMTQPSFILSVLINGATYIHFSMEDIEKKPDLLTSCPLKILGVNSQLRDILMDNPVLKPDMVNSWFRDVSESTDIHVWDIFIKKLEFGEIPAGCMVWNASMGGCLLFSRKRRGQAFQNVLPMPGRKWKLVTMEDNGVEALGGTGLLSVSASLESDGDSYIPTQCILTKTYLEYLFAGISIASRKGVYYPKDFVTEIVQKTDMCENSVVVEIPNIDGKMATGFHLLIFTGHVQQFDPGDLIIGIKRTIRSEIGKIFSVDDIRLIPFFPRRGQDNKIDKDWCCLQYLHGGFKNKLKDELFLNLSRLRAYALKHQ